jgi:hypothetical protein
VVISFPFRHCEEEGRCVSLASGQFPPHSQRARGMIGTQCPLGADAYFQPQTLLVLLPL